MSDTPGAGPMREWFKTYGVACVLLGSAIVGGTIWMVEKEVQAQTAGLKSQIAILTHNVGNLQKNVGNLQKKVDDIEDRQKSDSKALSEILRWVQSKKAEAEKK